MNSAKAWFYMTGQGEAVQNHGPFPVETMKGVFLITNMRPVSIRWVRIIASDESEFMLESTQG